jgi:hypothetical protein
MDFVYGTDYPDAEWIDRDGQPIENDPYRDVPPPDGPTNDPDDPSDPFETAVTFELNKLRTRREAQRRLDAETRPPITYPPVTPLNTLLDEPDELVSYRIDQVAPKQGNVILAAQYKSGKTILGGNLIRSLVDGDPFLGKFEVHQRATHLVLIDNELGRDTARRWLREQNIRNARAVADVITLRGRVSTFNILDDKIRDQWATRFADLGCDYLMLDCLRPCLDALGLDENRDVGKFLVAFDTLLADAGIADSFISQHMGHANERSRGDSRLQDWPDALWRMMRETDDPASPRYFTAYGRDVDVHEGRLSYDEATRRLTYAPGSRRNAKTEAAQLAVIKVLAAVAKDGGDPLSKRDMESALVGEHGRDTVRDGIALAVKHGLVKVEDGPRNALLHSIAYPCAVCGMPVANKAGRHLSCPTSAEEVVEGLFE